MQVACGLHYRMGYAMRSVIDDCRSLRLEDRGGGVSVTCDHRGWIVGRLNCCIDSDEIELFQ